VKGIRFKIEPIINLKCLVAVPGALGFATFAESAPRLGLPGTHGASDQNVFGSFRCTRAERKMLLHEEFL
jgi:hypothetical protein